MAEIAKTEALGHIQSMPDVTGRVIMSASIHANLHHFVAGKATLI
jgi:hypothetical protein